MTAYLKGSLIDKVLTGCVAKESIDETLDTATLITESTTISPQLWDDVEIENKHYLIADINIETLKDGTNRYILSLVEPTKYLEKFVLSFASTNASITLADQIERLLNNVEILRNGDTPRFYMSSSLITFLGLTGSEDFTFDRQTLRECLDAMLSVVNARCEVYEITDTSSVEIDFYTFDVTSTDEITDMVNKVESQNVEMLGTDIDVKVTNTFTGDRDVIYHPSPLGWDTFKTNEAILTSSNAMIRASFPIEEIKSFIVKTHFTADYLISDTEKYHTYQSQEIDMIRNVVSKEIWDILPTGNLVSDNNLVITDTLYQANTIYYTRESEEIGSKEVKYNLFFSASSFQVALRNAIYILKKDDIQSDLEEPPAPYTLYNIISYGGYNVADYDDALFRIGYQPYIDAHARIGKKDYRTIKSTIISAQTDKIIDLKRLGIMVSDNINRFGNQEITIDAVDNDVVPVGSILPNGYIVTESQVSYMSGFNKIRYTLSKNNAKINGKIGIDRKRQIYAIPLEKFKIDLLLKYIIYFSKTSHVTAYQGNLIKAILRTLSTTTNTPITNVLIVTDAVASTYELPVADFQIAYGNLFTFKFQDNYSVGMSNVGEVIGGIKTTPNPYVDANGEYTEIRLRLFSDGVGISRSDDYDIVKLLPKTNEGYYDADYMIVDETLSYIKDRYEHQSVTVQVEYLSDDVDIIIGDAFSEINGLINDEKIALTLYVSETLLYSKGDTQPKGGTIAFTVTYNEYRVGISCAGMGAMNSWALVSNGKIVIACNHRKSGSTSYIYAKCVYER